MNIKIILVIIGILISNLLFSQLEIVKYEMHHKKEYLCYDTHGTITFSEDSISSYLDDPELSMVLYNVENYNGYYIGYLSNSKKPVIVYRHNEIIFIYWKKYHYRLHLKNY